MRTNYNALIGYNTDGDAVILLDTFDHGGGFHGATGAILELVSQGEYDYRTSGEALQEYAEELWRDDAGQRYGTTYSLQDWTEANWDNLLEMLYDDSYSDLVPEGEHVATNCISCGRIFPGALDDIEILVSPDLADVIYEAEK